MLSDWLRTDFWKQPRHVFIMNKRFEKNTKWLNVLNWFVSLHYREFQSGDLVFQCVQTFSYCEHCVRFVPRCHTAIWGHYFSYPASLLDCWDFKSCTILSLNRQHCVTSQRPVSCDRSRKWLLQVATTCNRRRRRRRRRDSQAKIRERGAAASSPY